MKPKLTLVDLEKFSTLQTAARGELKEKKRRNVNKKKIKILISKKEIFLGRCQRKTYQIKFSLKQVERLIWRNRNS